MQTRITKEFQFHAAHQLPNHDGQCARLHGHTYRVEVTIQGPAKRIDHDKPHPREGMVLDFGELKEIWQAELEPHLEHQFLNLSLGQFLPQTKATIFVHGEEEEPVEFHAVTTAENLADWIYRTFRKNLPVGVPVWKVRVWETPTSSAEVCVE